MSSPEKVRVTYVMTKTVDMNVEAAAAIEGKAKNDFVETAIRDCLSNRGIDPELPPNQNFLPRKPANP